MSSATFRQELPPPNGYEKIVYQRVPLKAPWPTWTKILLVVAYTGAGAYFYRKKKMRTEDERLEMRAARQALLPLMAAEKTRMMLKNLKEIREREEELMKNVPGWETGTLYGEPVYKTIDPKEFYEPSVQEVYSFSHPMEYDKVLLHTRFG